MTTSTLHYFHILQDTLYIQCYFIVGLINVMKNAHYEFYLAKQFGNATAPQTQEAIERERNVQEMWKALSAPENNIHPRRTQQKAIELLERFLGVTRTFTKGIQNMVNDEGDGLITFV